MNPERKFNLREPIVAVQWFRNGDHPDDGSSETEGKVVRYFRRPDIPGDTICKFCGWTMHHHGWIDNIGLGTKVCPGDYIIPDPHIRYTAIRRKDFEVLYKET